MKKKVNINGKSEVLFYSIISIMLVIILGFVIKIYLDHVENETNKILQNTDTSYKTKNIITLNNGLKRVSIKNDLTEYIKGKNIKSITYKVDGENFYFDITINETEEGYSFDISKIVDNVHKINAKMKMKNIKEIDFMTGNSNDATLLNLITNYDEEYFVMTENMYYFLGSDIESISYMNNHFYYMSYNPVYRTLEEAVACDNATKKSIDGFNMNHYYYRYGKINFLKEYYQKLASKTYTVKDKCAELDAKNSTTDEN